jgi:hypothetical protein
MGENNRQVKAKKRCYANIIQAQAGGDSKTISRPSKKAGLPVDATKDQYRPSE